MQTICFMTKPKGSTDCVAKKFVIASKACLRFQDISSDVHFQSIWENSEELSNMYIQTTKIIFCALTIFLAF